MLNWIAIEMKMHAQVGDNSDGSVLFLSSKNRTMNDEWLWLPLRKRRHRWEHWYRLHTTWCSTNRALIRMCNVAKADAHWMKPDEISASNRQENEMQGSSSLLWILLSVSGKLANVSEIRSWGIICNILMGFISRLRCCSYSMTMVWTVVIIHFMSILI
jgi:hypothetical protein